ncbi:tyrosine-type recombinase/integrase [Bacillus haynesii]|uniref:tyrosine-type recombinase/integrase n=1 Tax=Bacillus haynesii TaxID=1925021 RepID=UPI002280A66E|nr:tyrosine-type recombinase/integrase [Bacillus haynesii]MCY8378457.1 site-specific integrase [Bacillus haynesii]MCY8611574.1 site-specific integrase [Bacillus haynesii]MEC0676712.1 tyrosine-type recombinase/integrase [Bacillus haynesii]
MAYIEKRGKNKYRLSVIIGYDSKGNKIRETRTVTAKNRTEAKKMLSQFETEVYKGHYVKVNKQTTLLEFFDEWYEKYAIETYSPKTLQNYVNDLRLRVLPLYGHMKLVDIETIHVVNFMNKLKKDGQRVDGKGKLSSSTISNCYKAFNSILSCASEWNYIKENPATPAKPPKPKYKKSDVYSKEEVADILSHLNNKPFRWKVLILLALSTGAREGEIAGLEFKHVDFDNGTIHIEQSVTSVKGEGVKLKGTKTGRERLISIPEPLQKMLKKLETIRMKEKLAVGDRREWPDHFFIFASETGRPLRPDSIYQWWLRFTKKHNLKRIRFHELRHTSATLLINEGVHPKVISERLGHADISTTMNIYGHVLREADKTAAKHFNNLFNDEKKA